MFNVIINGNEETVTTNSLPDYLESKNINIDHIVVEINGNILEKESIKITMLNENDKIEIIRFMGGG